MKQMILLAFALAVFVQISSQQGIPPAAVTNAMASRMERIHHGFFHNVRTMYTNLGPKQQKAISDLAWAPSHLGAITVNGTFIELGGAMGEDFLYMHHRMIQTVNKISEEANSTWRVVGWENCPTPDDSDWPVPPTYTIPTNAIMTGLLVQFKSDEFYNDVIVAKEAEMNDSDYLRGLSLGELGFKLETELHFLFHQRFSGPSSLGYRVQDASPVAEVDPRWDVPAYDWLGDFYSAHVNPAFWKIHGWVEDKIDQWREANGYDRIYWSSTWEGGPMNEVVVRALFDAAKIEESSDSSDSTDNSDSSDSANNSDDSSSEGSTDYEIDNHLLLAMQGILSKTKHD